VNVNEKRRLKDFRGKDCSFGLFQLIQKLFQSRRTFLFAKDCCVLRLTR
jgi:hypothetical protein